MKTSRNVTKAFANLPIKERVRLVVANARDGRRLLSREEHQQLVTFSSHEDLTEYNRLIKWYSLGNDFFQRTVEGYNNDLALCSASARVFYKDIAFSNLRREIVIALEESMIDEEDGEGNPEEHPNHMALEIAKSMTVVERVCDEEKKTISIELRDELSDLMAAISKRIYQIIESLLVDIEVMRKIERDVGIPIFSDSDAEIITEAIETAKQVRRFHNDIFFHLLAHDVDSKILGFKKIVPKLNDYIIKWPKGLESLIQEHYEFVGSRLDEVQKDLQNEAF